MRILVLGAGSVGAVFGARLLQAGGEVAFAVRPRRAEQLSRDGLTVRFPDGSTFHQKVRLEITPDVSEPYDVVLLSCKAYDLDSAIVAVAPAVGPGTVVVPLLNGVRHLEQLDAALGADRVAGGTCHFTAAVEADGGIRQVTPAARIAFGARAETSAAGRAALKALQGLFERSPVESRLSPDIHQEMWEKFVFLATFAAATCLMRAPIGPIVSTQAGARLVLDAFNACERVAADAGHALRAAERESFIATLTHRGSSLTASMFRDVEAGRPTEAEHIIGDMRSRMARLGAGSPLIEAAYAYLQIYEAGRRRD